jgi:hypothetical protein
MRRLFALAVVALHGLLILLLLSGLRLRPDAERQVPAFVSIWITPLSPVSPVAETRKSREAATAPAPRTALALPPPAEPEADREPVPTTAPRVDWMRESALAARRAAAESTQKRETFSDPPRALRKPCEPRKSSMEWNGAEDRRYGMNGIFPYVKIGNCMVSIGFFACELGSSPPNTHILDDMKDRDRIRASVPDKEMCE